MPLSYRNLTPAEQITLPLYPFTFTLLGVTLLLQAPARTSSPAYATAKLVAGPLPWLEPIHWWALAFLAVAAVEVLALWLGTRPRLYIQALAAGAGVIGFWLVMLVWSAHSSGQVSLTGWEWLLIPLGGQVASARQIASRETV